MFFNSGVGSRTAHLSNTVSATHSSNNVVLVQNASVATTEVAFDTLHHHAHKCTEDFPVRVTTLLHLIVHLYHQVFNTIEIYLIHCIQCECLLMPYRDMAVS